jgi:hypothetical protein
MYATILATIVAYQHVPTLERTRSGGLYYHLGDFRTLFPPFLPLPLTNFLYFVDTGNLGHTLDSVF